MDANSTACSARRGRVREGDTHERSHRLRNRLPVFRLRLDRLRAAYTEACAMNNITAWGCLTPKLALQIDEFLERTNPDDPERANMQRTIEPERQYADMGAYVAPGYVAG